MTETLADDFLDGMKAISRFTGKPAPRCYYLAEKNLLPGVFKEGSRWVGSKASFGSTMRTRRRGVRIEHPRRAETVDR
ncbi:hypothetical protein ACVME8_000156 [Bradyrhizobium diazoefficiens]